MTKKQHYMTHDERMKLEAYRESGMPVAEIARKLGFCRQTIYNELKLGEYSHTVRWWEEKRYSAGKSDDIHESRKSAKGRPIKLGHDYAYAKFLEDKILGRQENGRIEKRKRFSPAAALAAARKMEFQTSVCVATLYSYIEKGVFLHLTNKDLWEKSKRKKNGYRPVQRIAHPTLPSITDRPDYINSREEPGHWEMDLVVSCAAGRGAILTLTERTGRREIIRKLPNKKAETIRAELDKLERSIPRFHTVVRSITTDNGPEFLEHEKLRQSIRGGTRFDVYYCHSYAAWEKGTNENHNRMIRRWFPKGTDFNKISAREIKACEQWMNDYPRKSLDWMTPNEFAQQIAV
jgi:IS30 family transposase